MRLVGRIFKDVRNGEAPTVEVLVRDFAQTAGRALSIVSRRKYGDSAWVEGKAVENAFEWIEDPKVDIPDYEVKGVRLRTRLLSKQVESRWSDGQRRPTSLLSWAADLDCHVRLLAPVDHNPRGPEHLLASRPDREDRDGPGHRSETRDGERAVGFHAVAETIIWLGMPDVADGPDE